MASDSAASTAFQSVTYCPINCCMPRVTVLVLSDGARISGNHRSFQVGIMVNTATVAMAGRISGTTTWKKMREFANAVATRRILQLARHLAHEFGQDHDRQRQALRRVDQHQRRQAC